MIDLDDLEDLFDDLSVDRPTKDQLFTMYGHYLNDIVRNPICIGEKELKFNSNASKHPICRGKHVCFEHIITRESKYTDKRIFDYERANKVHWIKPIIENVSDFRIKYFEAVNSEGFNQQFYWYEAKMFIIIIREINPDILLITSFSVDKINKTEYKTMYENYQNRHKKTPLRK